MFDQGGKQIAGHRLTHDPQTNVFHCYEWNVAAQDYKEKPCPSGEESASTPEQVKKFTEAEVMQQLQLARAAAAEAKPQPATTGESSAPTSARQVAIILPAEIRPGERVSGSVVEDPARYSAVEGVSMTTFALPFSATGPQSTLAGWVVDISGEPSRPADGPIVLTVPPGQLELAVAIHPKGNVEQMVAKRIPLPPSAKAKGKAAGGYFAPAICMKDELCLVRGVFSGDSSKTFAAIENRPAKIVAESSDAAYIAVPERTEAGSRPLAIAEGSTAVAFPMVVAALTIQPEHRELKKGETLLMYPELEGPDELPDALWIPGNYPPWHLKQIQQLVPGFKMPKKMSEHEAREAKEKAEGKGKDKDKDTGEEEEGAGGEIVLVLKNANPGQISFRDSSSGSYVFYLKPESFGRGEFAYKFVAEANQPGVVSVEGHAISLLAPLKGQEFPLTANVPAK